MRYRLYSRGPHFAPTSRHPKLEYFPIRIYSPKYVVPVLGSCANRPGWLATLTVPRWTPVFLGHWRLAGLLVLRSMSFLTIGFTILIYVNIF